jgi:uncharacterized protein YndB with AHSA1/START domain
MKTAQDCSTARIELETLVAAPVNKVWQTIIERPNDWWVAEMRCVSADSIVSLRAEAGGTLTETSPSGASLLWFTVIAVEPEHSLNLAGMVAPPFGGPYQGCLLIQLKEAAGGTRVKFTNTMIGRIDEAALPSIDAGWRLLLDTGIKACTEA